MKKIKNPLNRRIFRELRGDWRKYLVIFLFLILTIGAVSGMYVANNSMMTTAEKNVTGLKLEFGHFELDQKADSSTIRAIASGEKADLYQYYLDEAKQELDDTFTEEFTETFDEEFTETFNEEFADTFDKEFENQYAAQTSDALTAQGLDKKTAAAMAKTLIEEARSDGSYEKAYNKAYKSAYKEAWEEAYEPAYEEAYETAYEEAWEEVQQEVSDAYEEAAEKYELNSDDAAVPVTIYENFFRNESEGTDNTVRVFIKTEDINLPSILEGTLPEAESEIAIDRMHADNAGIKVGDNLDVGGETFTVTGLIAYVNYTTLHEKNSDLMFDALKFDVAMVTDEGFDRLGSPIHYNYAWMYEQEVSDDTEQKQLSDTFLKVLLTQTVASDLNIEEYIPRYANAAVNFAPEDMGSDMAMGGVLLYILIGIIAFIFAVTSANTMAREASAIGTLRASGYTRSELVRHYLTMPVLVTLLSAVIGNILGYTVFKNVVTSMYYNSYSLPAYETVWNSDAFLKTTVVPILLMLLINFVVIRYYMQLPPLKFLRHDLKRRSRKKAMRLPGWSFFARFRLRIIFQNLSGYLILLVGVFFVSVLLAMAVGMPSTLAYYQDNVEDMMFSDFQYVLKDYEDEDGDPITTQNAAAEEFSMTSLIYKSTALDEEVSVYGTLEDSQYIALPLYKDLKTDEVYISEPFSKKYNLSEGDSFTLDEKYENSQYTFTVSGIYETCPSIAVFMPMDQYRTVFDTDESAFTGFLSDTEITDLDEDNIATVITQREITKMADQLDHSMGAYMTYFQYVCILLSAILIYLLTKIIIERNETSISMLKILGYGNNEIDRLYILSTTLVMLAADLISTIAGTQFMAYAWKAIFSEYSGYFAFTMAPAGYLKIFGFIFAGYLLVLLLDLRRIRKISLEAALKHVE